ncbi:MAG TPA: type II secretion system protein GspM [Marinobacter sp.]|nr:type II secretion system protein GspM [Marinobacter sp.]
MAASMRDSFDQGKAWFNGRPVRERMLILVTVLVLVVLVGWELAVTPVLTERQRLENRESSLLVSRNTLLERQQDLTAQLATDPSKVLRDQLSMRQQLLEELNQRIAQTTSQLIAPKAMVALLRDMLAAQTSLKLQSLELKTPTPVFALEPSGIKSDAAGQQSEEPLLYAHDVELKIQGSYLDVLLYLKHLETLDERLGWVILKYDAANWPAGEAVIQVRTLGLEPAWLGV